MGIDYSTEAYEEWHMLKEYNQRLYELDHQMYSLLFSMDIMGESIRELESNVLCKDKKLDDDKLSQIVNRLVTDSQWTIQDQKNKAAKLLLSLREFMNKNIKEKVKSDNVDIQKLKIENYCHIEGKTDSQTENKHLCTIYDRIKNLSEEIQEKTSINTRLKRRLETFIAVERDQRVKVESLEKDFEKEIEKLNFTHEQEKRQTNETIEKLKKEAQIASEKHKKSLEEQKSHFASLHEKSKTLKIENEALTNKVNKLEKRVDDQERNMRTVLTSHEKYKEQMQEKERNLNDEIQKRLNLEKDLRTVISDLQTKQLAFASQENDLLETKTELKETQTNLTRTSENLSLKTEELANIKVKLTDTRQKMSQMVKEIHLKTNEVDYLCQQIELLKRKKRLPVQLLCHKSSDLTKQLETSLEDLFRREFESDRLELEFWKCSKPSDIQPEYPLLVTCLTASRLSTDVANSLQGITLSPNMAIVIFHLKDEHALPNQLSERVLTGKNFQDIGGIFDMAYFSDKGIYPCEMNSNSTTSLMVFVKRVASELKL